MVEMRRPRAACSLCCVRGLRCRICNTNASLLSGQSAAAIVSRNLFPPARPRMLFFYDGLFTVTAGSRRSPRDAQKQLRICSPRMSATNSDWDCGSELKSSAGENNQEAVSTPTLAPQPDAEEAHRPAGCQGAHRNCAAAGLCRRQQVAGADPQRTLKRSCSAVEEEEEKEESRCRPHQRVPESESDRAFMRKVRASPCLT